MLGKLLNTIMTFFFFSPGDVNCWVKGSAQVLHQQISFRKSLLSDAARYCEWPE